MCGWNFKEKPIVIHYNGHNHYNAIVPVRSVKGMKIPGTDPRVISSTGYDDSEYEYDEEYGTESEFDMEEILKECYQRLL